MGALIGGGALALTVHGPRGVVDLVVPSDAQVEDVAHEYAVQCGLDSSPALSTRTGEHLPPAASLASRRIDSGSLLVAAGELPWPATVSPRGGRGARGGSPAEQPGAASAFWVALAAGIALIAGWAAAGVDGRAHDATVVALGVAALSGLVPVGAMAARRAVAAPAFAGAAAYAVAWQPGAERLPTIVGVAALVAAVVAALARAVDRRAEEALRVWIIAGSVVFVVGCGAALLDAAPQVVWAVLFVAAVFAARLVPSYAVDVPDNYLIDLERLAVTAWSAREQPKGKRSRTIVPEGAVADVASRGARTLSAAAWAVLAVIAVSAPLLLVTATASVDRVGARIVVIAGACGVLLSARSYRYALPRLVLRAGGLGAMIVGLAVVLDSFGAGLVAGLIVAAVVVGLVMVAAAVATGRGWRSVWWSARAELAEALAGAVALSTLVVATGLFRVLWESRFGS